MATTLLLWAVLWIGSSFPQATPPRAPDVFYVPTPPAVVDAMLELAKVGPNDVVYDLGCGDGRIPIAAAQKFGAHGVGIDIDPKRIEEATENAKAANVTDRVRSDPRISLRRPSATPRSSPCICCRHSTKS